MKINNDRKEFAELYKEYIGDFDDNYQDETVSDERLNHEMYVELDLLGVDISRDITDEDIARLERYRMR